MPNLSYEHYPPKEKMLNGETWHPFLEMSAKMKNYTPEVGGSSVWQISKNYFAGVVYGQKSLMC